MDNVVHFEIPFDNQERAIKFYKKIFGWDIEAIPKMQYHIVRTAEVDKKTMMPKTPGAINGGMFKRMENETPIIVINVPSIDDYAKKIKTAGGKVVMPKQSVGDMGFYAKIQDTEGNIIGIWENIKK